MHSKVTEGLGETKNTGEIEVHFIKSNYFRVVHVDGAWGGVTPNGYIQMAVYNQRNPIPKRSTEKVQLEGNKAHKIKGSEKIEGKTGIVREIESELLFDLKTAKSVVQWLAGHIKILEQLQAEETTSQSNE